MISDLNAPPLWRLEVRSTHAAAPAFEAILEAVCVAVHRFEIEENVAWGVEGYTDAPPDEDAINQGLVLAARAAGVPIPALTVEFLTPRDWLAENQATFQPLRLGRFFVHPSHFDGAVPAAMVPFQIDAATAFGSGTHPTTRTCVMAMEDLAKKTHVRSVLDLGCGSGLLSFAGANLWPAKVVGVDIDPEAVRVARNNAILNGVAHKVRIARSIGYRSDIVRRMAPFDLIVANVLARPLIKMAAETSATVTVGGHVILSGLVIGDAAWVTAHHRARGLRLLRRYVDEDWATLVFRRAGA
jgi:ribosomal protein L11 methyltransferase